MTALKKYRSLPWPRHLHLRLQTHHAFRRVLCEHRHTMTHNDSFNGLTRSLFGQKLHTHSTFSNYGVIRCFLFFPLVWDLYQRCTRHHFSQPHCLSLCLLMAGMECLSAPLVPTGKKKRDVTPSINNVSFPSHFSQTDCFLNLICLLVSYLKMCNPGPFFFVAFVFQKVPRSLKGAELSEMESYLEVDLDGGWWVVLPLCPDLVAGFLKVSEVRSSCVP